MQLELSIRPRAILPNNICVDCGSSFPATYKPQGGTRQPTRCKPCAKLHEKERVVAKEFRRRLRRHGLTIADYEALLASQGGTCAFATCCKTDDGRGRSLHIDHDHDCCPGPYGCRKCVRGLLCAQHNLGYGFFPTRDDIQDALDYHERTTQATRLERVF